jgi:hypothetical protein
VNYATLPLILTRRLAILRRIVSALHAVHYGSVRRRKIRTSTRGAIHNSLAKPGGKVSGLACSLASFRRPSPLAATAAIAPLRLPTADLSRSLAVWLLFQVEPFERHCPENGLLAPNLRDLGVLLDVAGVGRQVDVGLDNEAVDSSDASRAWVLARVRGERNERSVVRCTFRVAETDCFQRLLASGQRLLCKLLALRPSRLRDALKKVDQTTGEELKREYSASHSDKTASRRFTGRCWGFCARTNARQSRSSARNKSPR